jgi:N-acetylneuraminic acid mutarotase
MSCASLCRSLAVSFSLSAKDLSNRISALVLPAMLLAGFHVELRAQTNEWTWVTGGSTVKCSSENGTTTCNQPGVYGTLGTPGKENTPGGRQFGVSWSDSQGHLWLFGGDGYDSQGTLSYLNDLWEFDPSIHEWTWISGSSTNQSSCQSVNGVTFCGQSGTYGELGTSSAMNVPGGRRGASSWTDPGGHLWLFGGWGFDANGVLGALNDVWEFDPSSSKWTWVGGSSSLPCLDCGRPGIYGTLGTPAATNVPGGRYESSVWTDNSGNIWLFGGIGFDSHGISCYLDDLWEFDQSTNEWTWKSGYNYGYSPGWGIGGVYGTMGVVDAQNYPGSRNGASSWTDHNGNLWLFAGYGFDAYNNSGLLNDVWEFMPSSNKWVWMGGGALNGGNPGIYGTLGIPSSTNIPGQRAGAVTWRDNRGYLWMDGGSGEDSATTNLWSGDLNDLWAFDPAGNQWAWMGGNTSFGNYGWHSGVYGNQLIPAAGNLPGGRQSSISWTDGNGNLWLFGGAGYDLNGTHGLLNDLWKYQPSTSQLPPAITPIFEPPPGAYPTAQTVTVKNGMDNATIYYTTDGTTPSGSSSVYSGAITVSSTETIRAIASAQNYSSSDVSSATYSILPQAAKPQFSVSGGTYTSPQVVVISDSTPGAVIYYNASSVDPTTASTVYTGPITVSSTGTIRAIAVAPNYANSLVSTEFYTINLQAAATPTFSPAAGTYTSVQTVTISDSTVGAAIYYTTNGSAPTTSSSQYSGPITVASSETVQAIATEMGYGTSDVASAIYTINLPPPNFGLAESASTLTVGSGGRGAVTLTVTPQNGFNAAVSFSCSGLPSGASCAFSPETVTPTSGAVTTTLTISTAAKSAALRSTSNEFPLEFAALLTLGIWGIRKRRKLGTSLLLVTFFCGLSLFSACGGGGGGGTSGGGGGAGGSTTTVSTVAITATSGTLQQSAKLTLTVN